MSEKDHYLKKQAAPGGIITTYAFKYACSFYDFADEKLPELKRYPPDKERGILLQAAIIVSTLILMDRRSGGVGRKELHNDVAQSFAYSVKRRNLSAVQDLSCALLQSNREGLKADEIPSFSSLAAADDAQLAESMGVWVARALTKKQQLEPSDLRIAAALGRSARTSAAMIVRMLQPK